MTGSTRAQWPRGQASWRSLAGNAESRLLPTLAIVAIAVVVLLLWLKRLSGRPESPVEPLTSVNPDGSGRFQAISIRVRPDACDAARALHGERFLAAEVPELPLPACTAVECGCRFVRHRDRRSGEDRRSPFQSGFGGSSTRREEDRRRTPDRRTDGGGDPAKPQ